MNDEVVCACLTAAAIRHAQRPERHDADALTELRSLADSRVDLLGQVAGLLRGRHYAEPDVAWGYDIAADYCLQAGGDEHVADAWFPTGQKRATHAGA